MSRKVLRMEPGEGRGQTKTRWKDACQRDLKSTGLRAGEETDRATWSRKISSHTSDGKRPAKSRSCNKRLKKKLKKQKDGVLPYYGTQKYVTGVFTCCSSFCIRSIVTFVSPRHVRNAPAASFISPSLCQCR